MLLNFSVQSGTGVSNMSIVVYCNCVQQYCFASITLHYHKPNNMIFWDLQIHQSFYLHLNSKSSSSIALLLIKKERIILFFSCLFLSRFLIFVCQSIILENQQKRRQEHLLFLFLQALTNHKRKCFSVGFFHFSPKLVSCKTKCCTNICLSYIWLKTLNEQ